ncbi:hypothetical protein Acr_00g0018780 [Actinidia rufa]|uniref:HAT C-terminal dimerisation domain-containing protein n=1 Tax=Actinidia rufa TaxID=165716 RepID=A0A7J0DBV2_9ERIC|nr:hypothetical protein Acr_00g0018780 [Actinidia rufa]
MGEGVERIRDSVHFWMTTPSRVEKFEEAARQLRVQSTKKLALDCRTRWNSTYVMLQTAMTNGLKYPSLQLMAGDILAIPMSTVASELAFSTSGRVITPHCSHLSHDTLEALMCAQNWLRNEIEGTSSCWLDDIFSRNYYGPVVLNAIEMDGDPDAF